MELLIFCYDNKYSPPHPLNDWYFVISLYIYPPFLRSFKWSIFCYDVMHPFSFPLNDWYFVMMSNIFPPFLWMIDIFFLWRQTSPHLSFEWLIFCYDVKHCPCFPLNDWYFVMTSNIFPPFFWMIDILLWCQTFSLLSFEWLIFCYDVKNLPSFSLNKWYFVITLNIFPSFY